MKYILALDLWKWNIHDPFQYLRQQRKGIRDDQSLIGFEIRIGYFFFTEFIKRRDI